MIDLLRWKSRKPVATQILDKALVITLLLHTFTTGILYKPIVNNLRMYISRTCILDKAFVNKPRLFICSPTRIGLGP